MSYIILVGIAFAILCWLLYMGLSDEGAGGDEVTQALIDKSPKQAKPKAKPTPKPKPAKRATQPKTPSAPAPAKRPQATTKDDLTSIEGVGPKIATLLTKAGIYSFKQLGTLEVAELKRIVTDGGVFFREKVAATWSEQATLAGSGQWEALAKLQARLKGGSR